MKFFLAVAQGKSLSAAAQSLGVSPSTVSRRLDALEQALQVQLFRPHRDGYELTEVGQGLVSAAEQAGARMQVFERNARETGDDLSGPVRIEAPELLGQEILLPALIGFMETYPRIRVELRGAVQPVRLAAEEADIVLRLVRPTQGNYRIKKIASIRFALYASTDYVRRHGTPQMPEDLHRHRVVGWTDDLAFLTMATWLGGHIPGLRPSLRLNSFSAQVEAVRKGAGWAVLPEFIASPADFVRGLEGLPSLNADLWLLVHEQAQTLPRVKLVRDCIVAALRGWLRP
ncbi:LysR family transcriptional regulator [Paracoccus lutimaris]|uniref:LysR family transcriptional regulator n=1 Tax=Paracoccus lutimaris TaxID=1490030 RepID=UPI003CCC4CEE